MAKRQKLTLLVTVPGSLAAIDAAHISTASNASFRDRHEDAEVTHPVCGTQVSIVERCRGKKELVPEMWFEKVDR
jgi:hypothetical protein